MAGIRLLCSSKDCRKNNQKESKSFHLSRRDPSAATIREPRRAAKLPPCWTARKSQPIKAGFQVFKSFHGYCFLSLSAGLTHAEPSWALW